MTRAALIGVTHWHVPLMLRGFAPAGVGVKVCLPSEYRTSRPTPTFREKRQDMSTPAL